MRQMLEHQADAFYYVTLMNENYPQVAAPVGVETQIIRGMYRLCGEGDATAGLRVQLLGAGAILREVIAAAALLWADFAIASDVFSVTSFSELARDACTIERHNRLHPDAPARQSHIETLLSPDAPVIAATAKFVALGTDGFGRSDTRAALRDFFEVDRRHIAVAAIDALVRSDKLPRRTLADALTRYAIDTDRPAPWTR
jgi:pyruvate dehydrogenase E1 component